MTPVVSICQQEIMQLFCLDQYSADVGLHPLCPNGDQQYFKAF